MSSVRRSGSDRLAWVLGGAAMVLALAAVPLSFWAHQATFDELLYPLMVVPFAAVGWVLARRVPGNAIGWIMLLLSLAAMWAADDGMYAVRAVGLHDAALPLPRVAVFMAASWVWMVVLLPLPIALFPAGRIPAARLRWTLPVYAVVAVLLIGSFVWQDAAGIGARKLTIDSSGELAVFNQGSGWVTTQEHILFPLYALLSITWVVMQLVSWRRSSGVRRQQLKCLIAGAAVCLGGLTFGIVAGSSTAWSDLGWCAVPALPIGIGIGVLKYRLYDIDRLVSRTVSYATLTALLVAIFAGLVLLATNVLPIASPVAVAVSTLAVAALANPLRLRTQRIVDRRFNRSRYDAEAIVSAFGSRLRDATDLETVQRELEDAVARTIEPAQVWLLIRPGS